MCSVIYVKAMQLHWACGESWHFYCIVLFVSQLWTKFSDISASTVFDVLMDGPYRSTWDENAIMDYNVFKLDGCNDIGYYAGEYKVPLFSQCKLSLFCTHNDKSLRMK